MPGSVIVQRSDGVVEVVLSNPEQRNAMTPGMLRTLARVIEECERDGKTRALILRGEGDCFSSGYALDHSPGAGERNYGGDVAEVCDQLERSPMVSVAMVRGFAVGAALDVACACDFRFAEQGAWFALPAVRLGLVYPWRGMRRLQRIVGPSVVRRIFLAGERISTEEAVTCGLVARVFKDAEGLEAGTRAFVAEIATRSAMALGGTKRVLYELAKHDELTGEVAARVEVLTRISMEGADLRSAAEKAARKPVDGRTQPHSQGGST